MMHSSIHGIMLNPALTGNCEKSVQPINLTLPAFEINIHRHLWSKPEVCNSKFLFQKYQLTLDAIVTFRTVALHPPLTELHVQDENQQILAEMDAYILLMSTVPVLKPLAGLIGMPLIRPLLARSYPWQVNRRPRLSGRL